MKMKVENKTIDQLMRGDLSKDEWQELVALDYVLTREYSINQEQDLKRYKELSNINWQTAHNGKYKDA